MKLYQIWNAVPAWQALSALKKNPKLAYRLMKYGKAAAAELEVCEERRRQCVYEISGANPGDLVEIQKGTPEFDAFLAKFNEFLQGDSDLEVLDLTLAELIDALGAETGNCISEDHLELLEPFFKP